MTNRTKNSNESKLSTFLKVLAVVITSLGGAIGSYSAARSSAKQQADVSYQTLAANIENMRLTIENLKENENRLWGFFVRQQPLNFDKSVSSGLTPLHLLPKLTPLPKTLNDAMSKAK